MRLFLAWWALILALLGSSCSPSSAPAVGATPTAEASPDNRRTLVAFGDSLTEGLGVEPEQAYPAQLQRKLESEGMEWVVVNAGLAGETSSGARSRLEWVLKLQPDAVLLETGGNDGLRGIDPKVTEDNISFLVAELQRRRIPVLLAGMKTVANLGPDYTRPFEAVYPKVATRLKVPLIPFFLEGVAGSVDLNQADRIHPTQEGYTIVVERIYPQVKDWLASLPVVQPSTSP